MPPKSALSMRTVQHYMRTAMALERKVEAELGVKRATPEELVAVLLTQFKDGNWKPERLRLTKAAVLYWMGLFHQDRTDLIERLREAKAEPRKADENNKSTPVQSPLSPLAFQKAWGALEQALTERSRNDYKNALPLLAVLRATLLTGLRTREWGFSTVWLSDISPVTTLIICDHLGADALKGGSQREIVLDRLPESDLQTIKAAVQAFDGCIPRTVDKVVKRLQKEFAEAITDLLAGSEVSRGIKKNLTELSIRTFRQQFTIRARHTYLNHPLGPWILAELLDKNPHDSSNSSIPPGSEKLPLILVLPSPSSMKTRLNRLDRKYRDYFASFLSSTATERCQHPAP